MLSSVKIVPDSYSKIVHYTYYLTRDLLDCTTQSPRIFREKKFLVDTFYFYSSILPSSCAPPLPKPYSSTYYDSPPL